MPKRERVGSQKLTHPHCTQGTFQFSAAALRDLSVCKFERSQQRQGERAANLQVEIRTFVIHFVQGDVMQNLVTNLRLRDNE